MHGSRRSPGEGNDSSFQYSCLENSMDRGAGQVSVCKELDMTVLLSLFLSRKKQSLYYFLFWAESFYSTVNYDVSCRFSIVVFQLFEEVQFYQFPETTTFYRYRCCIFSGAFSALAQICECLTPLLVLSLSFVLIYNCVYSLIFVFKLPNFPWTNFT